jgi:hypothetical protein
MKGKEYHVRLTEAERKRLLEIYCFRHGNIIRRPV